MESGQLLAPQRQAIERAGAKSMSAIPSVAGGGAGATIAGLQRVTRGTQRALGELSAQESLLGLKMNSLIDSQTNRAATRKLAIQQHDKLQKMADATQIQKD